MTEKSEIAQLLEALEKENKITVLSDEEYLRMMMAMYEDRIKFVEEQRKRRGCIEEDLSKIILD